MELLTVQTFFQTQETEIEFVENQVDIATRVLFSGFANQGFILS